MRQPYSSYQLAFQIRSSIEEAKQKRLSNAVTWGAFLPNEISRAVPKCPSCGSREFRQHAGRSVCSYCRSEG